MHYPKEIFHDFRALCEVANSNLSEMHFGVNDDAILKANCKSYKIFIFLHQFFFLAFPQCNNNIAKSENFFMEIQKKTYSSFSLSNLDRCILEFNLKVFNLSTICYATIGYI